MPKKITESNNNKVTLSVRIEKETDDKIKTIMSQTGQTKTKVVELYTYFDKITNKDGHSVTLRINPRSKDIVAIVHTHPFGRGDNTTWFSTEDEIQASTFNIFVYAYGPDGDLRKLNPFTHKNILVPAELPLPAQ